MFKPSIPSFLVHKRQFSVTRSLNAKKPVGFIGLGNMGGFMATNLSRAGYPLVINDVNAEIAQRIKGIAPDRIEIASTPAEVAAKVDQVVTMLPSSPHVKSVYTNPGTGLTATMKEHTLCIDASTIDPGVAREVASEVAKHKSMMVDAPVSGGVVGAEKGTLTFMVGGSEEAFQRARELLSYMGKNIIHCGGSGNGQVVKVCNNLALAIEMIGISEAMNLGIKLGMDAKLLAQIFNTSTSRCWSSDTYNPVPGVMSGVPSSRDYAGGFGVDLMLKDLGLAIQAASSGGIPLPLGQQAASVYSLLSSEGFGKKDFSSIYQYLDQHSKSD